MTGRAIAAAVGALLSACGASPSAGNETDRPPASGNASLDGFIADLAAGRRDAALARLLGITTITGNPNAVPSVEALVDKLMTCTFLSSRPGRRDFPIYRVQWRCPDGDYEALVDADEHPPRLLIGQFQTTGTAEQWRRVPPAPPPPPSPPGRPRP